MINKKYEINIYKEIMHIKNYTNIIDYSKNNVVIKLLNLKLYIYGKELIINKLDEFELSILGKIEKLEFKNE